MEPTGGRRHRYPSPAVGVALAYRLADEARLEKAASFMKACVTTALSWRYLPGKQNIVDRDVVQGYIIPSPLRKGHSRCWTV